MNILSLNTFNITSLRTSESNVCMPKFGLKMTQPLQKDTVIFGSSPTTKKLVSKAKAGGFQCVMP